MKTYIVYNLKGGAGKTTTALLLALQLKSKGADVVVLDLDSEQHTALDIGPRIGLTVVGKAADVPPCNVLIIDTPPRLGDDALRRACEYFKQTDGGRLIIPMQPSIHMFELRAAKEMLDAYSLFRLEPYRSRTRVLFNQYSEGVGLTREAVEKVLGVPVMKAGLPRYQSYVSVMLQGWGSLQNVHARNHLNEVMEELLLD